VLCAVGDLIEDIVVQLHDHVQRDTDTAATIVRRRGGSATNVAYFAAKLSGASRFVGCIGSDSLGDSLIGQVAVADIETIRCGSESRVRSPTVTGNAEASMVVVASTTVISDVASSPESSPQATRVGTNKKGRQSRPVEKVS